MAGSDASLTGGPSPAKFTIGPEAIAPPSTTDSRKRAVCERIERLADQGKKLNLYLMVITQQPSKLHRGVLAECNNRLILRPIELDHPVQLLALGPHEMPSDLIIGRVCLILAPIP